MENFYFFTITYSNEIFLDFYYSSTYTQFETKVTNLLLAELIPPPTQILENLFDFFGDK